MVGDTPPAASNPSRRPWLGRDSDRGLAVGVSPPWWPFAAAAWRCPARAALIVMGTARRAARHWSASAARASSPRFGNHVRRRSMPRHWRSAPKSLSRTGVGRCSIPRKNRYRLPGARNMSDVIFAPTVHSGRGAIHFRRRPRRCSGHARASAPARARPVRTAVPRRGPPRLSHRVCRNAARGGEARRRRIQAPARCTRRGRAGAPPISSGSKMALPSASSRRQQRRLRNCEVGSRVDARPSPIENPGNRRLIWRVPPPNRADASKEPLPCHHESLNCARRSTPLSDFSENDRAGRTVLMIDAGAAAKEYAQLINDFRPALALRGSTAILDMSEDGIRQLRNIAGAVRARAGALAELLATCWPLKARESGIDPRHPRCRGICL